MSNKDKIILYIDGHMGRAEREEFESDLRVSKELSDELGRYRDFLSRLKELEDIPVEEDYFVNMAPNFRSRLRKKRKAGYLSKLALGATTAAALKIVALFFFKENRVNNVPVLQNVISQMNSSDVNSLLNSYSDQINLNDLTQDDQASYDSVLNSMIYKELQVSPNAISSLAGDNSDLSTMFKGVDQKEVDLVYNEILHKRIY